MNRTLLTAFIIACLVLPCPGCDSGNSVMDNNFHDSGFISDSRFQVVVKVPPSESARGLVQRRETSLEQGNALLLERVIDELWRYAASSCGSQSPETEKRFRKKISKIAAKGHTAIQYYDEDDAVTIVYRINKKNLKSALLALVERKEDQKEKK
ncbi:MAG TPA: hypothetical protein PK926_15920 [Spirochaetota bacterium]|nr:hypothetical protein [Spirochaetota bacterium]HPI90821.1 hypothetical protein [Spirochaetota bacterium]HPR47643.1 hypothetical protein [Spirochaetota bacterium]